MGGTCGGPVGLDHAEVEEAPVPEDLPCCICGQISGHPARDLIAAKLPGQPYARRVLLESESFAAIPSLGPLAPGHSLLCPKGHARSFAGLASDLDDELRVVKEELCGVLGRIYGPDIHIFEHGMAALGSRVLCTVEHAHLHVIPLATGAATRIPLRGAWADIESSPQALREQAGQGEYVRYEAPDGRTSILRPAAAAGVESQHMRKVFARSLGRPAEWDWRARPDAALADASWRQFSRVPRDGPASGPARVRPA
jgi:diadenosine tetraphosphate (Ap4A) HIT family hydrolase